MDRKLIVSEVVGMALVCVVVFAALMVPGKLLDQKAAGVKAKVGVLFGGR